MKEKREGFEGLISINYTKKPPVFMKKYICYLKVIKNKKFSNHRH